ncbi:MAG: hypothetical protein Q9166_004412 [cf. Caloplaca sp. 2 TL-2023]
MLYWSLPSLVWSPLLIQAAPAYDDNVAAQYANDPDNDQLDNDICPDLATCSTQGLDYHNNSGPQHRIDGLATFQAYYNIGPLMLTKYYDNGVRQDLAARGLDLSKTFMSTHIFQGSQVVNRPTRISSIRKTASLSVSRTGVARTKRTNYPGRILSTRPGKSPKQPRTRDRKRLFKATGPRRFHI